KGRDSGSCVPKHDEPDRTALPRRVGCVLPHDSVRPGAGHPQPRAGPGGSHRGQRRGHRFGEGRARRAAALLHA
ncbi:unnamed protein product, partial [Amoebophrya sp. A120]